MSTDARADQHPTSATATPPARELLGRFQALLASTGLANLADGAVQSGCRCTP